MRDVGALVVSEAEVTEHLSTGIGEGPFTKGVELTGVVGDAFLVDCVAEVEEGVPQEVVVWQSRPALRRRGRTRWKVARCSCYDSEKMMISSKNTRMSYTSGRDRRGS